MKKIIIIGAIILSLGIGTFVVGLAIGGFDWSKLQTNHYEKVVYESSENVTEIKISDKNTRIEIVPTNSDKVRIEYFSNDSKIYLIEEKDGILRANCTYEYKFSMFSVNVQSLYTKIEVPANKTIILEAETTNNKIDINGVNLDNVILKTTNGSINVDNVTVTEDLNSITTNGKINLNNVKAKNVSAKTSNSKINANILTVEDKINFNTTNNDIFVHEISANDISLITSNGDIEGKINGKMEDFSIISSTTNGKNELPSNYQPEGYTKKLYVKTTNDDIRISFKN